METECYEEEVQPYWKMDYKPIITIGVLLLFHDLISYIK